MIYILTSCVWQILPIQQFRLKSTELNEIKGHLRVSYIYEEDKSHLLQGFQLFHAIVCVL